MIARICRLARGDIFGVLSEFFVLLRLLQESENKTNLPPKEMPGTELTSYLRSHQSMRKWTDPTRASRDCWIHRQSPGLKARAISDRSRRY